MLAVADQAFTMTATVDGKETTVAWDSERGFEPNPEVEALIAGGQQLAVTPTGPFFIPGDKDAVTAYVTAFYALGGEKVRPLPDDAGAVIATTELEPLLDVPAGASA